MDEEIYQQLKDTILKTINNGIAFKHMSEFERDDREKEIVDFLISKGYEAFVEECMIYVIGKHWDKLMMMELTRNTLYFTPFSTNSAPEIVFYVLQFISKRYLIDGVLKKNTKTKTKEKQQVEEIESDSEEDTEEDPKPRPNFDFL